MLTRLAFDRLKQKIDFSILTTFFPAILGTIVEYYDYALYGFCASILAAQFFPTEDPTLALLKTFGIFLTGSLSKPIGAVIFGYIGDRFGRQISLKISMIGIIVPTTVIGILPTHEHIGWIAPFILLICRIFQGMFTSGESDGVRIFIYETVGQHRPCLANSISGIACMCGIYLASFAFSVIMRFEEYPNAWRIPFFIGGLMGLLVFWSRRYLTETPEFMQYLKSAEKSQENNLLRILLKNKRSIFSAILLCGSVGGIYHFYMVFFGHYLSNSLALISSQAIALYTAQALLLYTLFGPIAGMLADRFGPMQILKISLIGLLMAAIVIIMMIKHGTLNLWLFWSTTILISFFSTPGFL